MADNKSAKSEKVSPLQYLGQVRQEGRKVVWPTRPETTTTTILVMIMVMIMGAFFLVTDTVLGYIVNFVLSYFGGGA